MNKIFSICILLATLFVSQTSCAQDKNKRPSPPVQIKQTIKSGAEISIDYSQPSLKGRVIGKTIEPKDGEIWRTGANEATIFEVNKPVKINGQSLPAGKYALFSLSGKDNWTIIFNKTWKQWGAYDYVQAEDALRIKATATTTELSSEKMTFSINESGLVTLLWGTNKVTFTVE